MKHTLSILSALTSLLVATTVFAHHSTVGIYDNSRRIEVTGIIKAISWRNPHGRITIEVEENGKMVEWQAETASISILRNRGVTSDLLKVGDVVTMAGEPSRRGDPIMFGTNVLLPSGNEFTFGSEDAYFAGRTGGTLVGFEDEEVDTSAAIAAADGIFRVWSTIMSDPAAFPMFKGNYPFNAAGREALAQFNPTNNELFQCNTKGQPLVMISPIPMDFVRQGDDILMRHEEYDARRLIHMSPDAVAPEAHTFFGFSRGHWEGRDLVIETDHIQAGYFDHMGARQSDQIKTVERFMPNADYTRMDYTLTVTDPVYFSEPFTLTRYWLWYPDMQVHDYDCLERY